MIHFVETAEADMARFDLSDFEWSVIDPLLPQKSRGVKRVDDRRVLNGIFWRLRTGAPWADIPARYGPAHDLRQPLQPVAAGRAYGQCFLTRYQRLAMAISR